MVTKLAGPFSDTWRFSTSPRSRLRLRPARRAALTMTLIRAECSMISAQDDLSVRSGQGLMGFSESFEHDRTPLTALLPLGALRLWCRQGGSFGAEPPACGRLGLGAILRPYGRHCLVARGVALSGGCGVNMPFQALDLVHRRPLSAPPPARAALLPEPSFLFG